jgi:hypothetical protein
MKSKKIQAFLAVLLVFVLALPALGEYETLRQDAETEDYEDHPWGGDSYDPEDPPTSRMVPSTGSRTTYYLIELVMIFVFPGMDPGILGDNDSSRGVLPQDFGENNNRHNQKGQ